MSGFQLTAALVQALSWPVAALAIVLILRKPIAKMLGTRPPSRMKAGPFEVEWDRIAAETQKEVQQIAPPEKQPQADGVAPVTAHLRDDLTNEAQTAPAVAVLEAHSTVQLALQELLSDVPKTDRMSAVRLARTGEQLERVTPQTVKAVEGLTVLRNLAAHGSAREITPEQALDYLSLADATLYAIGANA